MQCKVARASEASDALPSFFPGYDAVGRIRVKHGIIAAVAGVVALGAGWFLGRR